MNKPTGEKPQKWTSLNLKLSKQMKRYTNNWANLPNAKPKIKIKDHSNLIPLRIDQRTVILIGVNHDPEKKRREYLQKHKLLYV